MYGDGPEFDALFATHDGMHARRAQVDRAATEVDKLSEATILAKSDEDIIASIQSKLSVVVPILKRDDISFERKMKLIERRTSWGEHVNIETPVFYFDVPYDGEDGMFAMRPSSYSSAPRGRARNGVLRISVVGEEDAAKLQQEVNSTLDSVDQYLGWHRQMWTGLEAEVATTARNRLAQRRQKLSSLGQAEAGLAGFGFKPKAGS